jgi:large conductance mechanosensitive channel
MARKSKEEKSLSKKGKGVIAEFGAFINRGSVVDMAVGVIIGGAFGSIVTALVNILLTLCTWGIPGGIAGLVTVLPAANPAQTIPQSAIDGAAKLDTPVVIPSSGILDVGSYASLPANYQSLFVAHGGLYYYKALPILDWGAFLTAIIDFLVIALVLFIIVKAVAKAKEQKAALDAKILEDYYTKHPEERPAPVVAGAPAPTEMDILVQIRDELKKASPEKK